MSFVDAQLKEGTPVKMVKEVDIHVHSDFAQNIYDSCKDIPGPLGTWGPTAVQLMCGKWGKQCNAERWFHFSGAGPYSPFIMNYKFSSKSTNSITPLDSQTISCEKGVMVS